MKTLTLSLPLRAAFAALVLSSLLAYAPVIASADTGVSDSTHARVGVVMSADNMVHAIGATVTAVSGSVVNATTSFGNTVVHWFLTVGSDTKVLVNGSASATTSGIAVGDIINFSGKSVATSDAGISVDAKRIKDVTKSPELVRLFGMLSGVNTANGSFLITPHDGATTTVTTNASTSIRIAGSDSSTIADLVNGSVAFVLGIKNTDGTILAKQVIVSERAKVIDWFSKHNDDSKNDSHDSSWKSQGEQHGLKLGFLFGLGAHVLGE